MNFRDLVKIGTKLDVRVSAQLKKQEETGERAPVYKSRVCDFLSDTELEISMPTLGDRMVLFQMGAECSIIFFTGGGMFTTTATVVRRYRRDNLYMLAVYLTGSLVRFQRREFYRVPYLADLEYQIIPRDVARSDSIQEVEYSIAQDKESFPDHNARTLDVSGGGLRFSTTEPLEGHTYLFTHFSLTSCVIDEQFSLVGQIISSEKHPKEPGIYINRLQFLFKDLRDREKIVRFVFDEERRLRSNKGAEEEE